MILSIYKQFTTLNNELMTYLNELISGDLKSKDNVISRLNDILNNIEEVKYKSDNIMELESDMDKVNNLRYSIMNSLFLLSDLLHFYKINEVDRFKMRAVNYINHNSKLQLSKERDGGF